MAPDRPPLELWGGVEATRNRVGDRFFDQLDRSGHASRIDDLDLIASLGIRTLRYPILWERVAPHGPDSADWAWSDARLDRLRQLGVRPIVTFVHHGSGPPHVDLLDSGFASGLAEFARAFAERYPWVIDVTPVNEPLTTARFSALYGHWHPHLRDMRATVDALLIQTEATIRSMTAMRSSNPAVRLIQTEDVGKVFSTPALSSQAEFENARRWLSLDLLCGRVAPGYELWDYLLWLGIDVDRLDRLRRRPCPPDIVGVNYYVTGERFLDDRLDRYPVWTHGRSDATRYADVEAVRVRRDGLFGLKNVLLETWDRFHLPIAVTECHLGSDSDEQIRWLEASWRAALDARAAGADVRALTAWSLLGAYDWNSLVTRDDGCYEPGAFDVRGGTPVETAVGQWIRDRQAGNDTDPAATLGAGWWNDPSRLLYSED